MHEYAIEIEVVGQGAFPACAARLGVCAPHSLADPAVANLLISCKPLMTAACRALGLVGLWNDALLAGFFCSWVLQSRTQCENVLPMLNAHCGVFVLGSFRGSCLLTDR